MTPRTRRFLTSYKRTVHDNNTDAANRMGVKRPNLVRVLSGKMDASMGLIEAYCKAYNVPIESIVANVKESDQVRDLRQQVAKLKVIIAEKDRTIKKLMKM